MPGTKRGSEEHGGQWPQRFIYTLNTRVHICVAYDQGKKACTSFPPVVQQLKHTEPWGHNENCAGQPRGTGFGHKEPGSTRGFGQRWEGKKPAD